MITELQIKGFKSLRDVTLPLGQPMTVLVGANNSGKSNALAALKLLRESAKSQDFQKAFQAMGGSSALDARGAATFFLKVTGQFGGINASYSMERDIGNPNFFQATEEVFVDYGTALRARRNAAGQWSGPDSFWNTISGQMPGQFWTMIQHPGMHPTVRALAREIQAINVVDLAVPSLRAESSVDANVTLGPDGLNIAAVVDMLTNTQPSVMKAVLKAVIHPITDIQQILTPPGARPGTKVIGVEETDGSVYRASEISDGLLLFIALSVATQMSGGGSLLAIEEPERGIHPRRIKDVVDQLRRIANQRTQVVLTTHSPILLDEFRDSPECVLIFDRTDKEGTQVHRLIDHPQWQDELTRKESLGEIWFSGLLGGVPR